MDIGALATEAFCDSMVTTAIESGPGGWFVVHEYKWQGRPVGQTFAVIEDVEDGSGERHRVDAALIRKGLDVIGRAVLREDPKHPADGLLLHNAETGQRLYLGRDHARRLIHAATASDDDDVDFDVVDALAVVECGLFGAVTYA